MRAKKGIATAKEPASAQAKGQLVLLILRHEFSKRVRKNPQYSLRSFARYLGMSHTLLSLLLNGHRSPSRKVAEKLAARLSFPPDKSAALLESTGKVQRESDRQAILAYRKIPLDEFALLSEWQHYAILSLLEIERTEFTPQFIAGRLGISVHLAKIAMDRLVDLKIVDKNPQTGRWRQKPGPIIVENTHSTLWTRKFQRQLIRKSLESLEQDPIEARDHSSTTFAMHPEHVPYALKRIREFRRELSAELEAFGDPREVYNLTVQLFPTSRPTDRKRNP